MKIRALLKEPPESRKRAIELHPLVEPICRVEKERKAFIETAAWSAGFSDDRVYVTRTLAADTIEHVATTCFASHPANTYALLREAKAAIPDTYRFDLMRARLAAAASDLVEAERSARLALDGGSVHARALLARIIADQARNEGAGYRPGMLDAAIDVVRVEPDGSWPLVDVAAMLSTRARLLTERAFWEEDEAAKKTLLEASSAFARLSVPPFIENMRRRAEDVHCFNRVQGGLPPNPVCATAGNRAKHLGAAKVGDVAIDATFDQPRLEAIEEWLKTVDEMEPKRVVVVVARGDESELIEWGLPTVRLLRVVAQKKPRVIAVDRTTDARASALFARMFELAGVEPEMKIAAKSTFAMPCLTATLAKRQTPQACPFEPARVKRLEKMTDFAFAVLVGRDLDAEIDDLHLYDLSTVLLSFRQSKMEKGIDAWLKSVSDVLLASPPSLP